MTITIAAAEPRRPWSISHWLWLAALAGTLALYLLRDVLPWADNYPKGWQLPLSAGTNYIMLEVIVPNLFVVTRALADVLNVPLKIAYALFERGF